MVFDESNIMKLVISIEENWLLELIKVVLIEGELVTKICISWLDMMHIYIISFHIMLITFLLL